MKKKQFLENVIYTNTYTHEMNETKPPRGAIGTHESREHIRN